MDPYVACSVNLSYSHCQHIHYIAPDSTTVAAMNSIASQNIIVSYEATPVLGIKVVSLKLQSNHQSLCHSCTMARGQGHQSARTKVVDIMHVHNLFQLTQPKAARKPPANSRLGDVSASLSS